MLPFCSATGTHSPTPEAMEETVTSPSISLQPPRLTPRCFVDYDRKKEEAEKGTFCNCLMNLELYCACGALHMFPADESYIHVYNHVYTCSCTGSLEKVVSGLVLCCVVLCCVALYFFPSFSLSECLSNHAYIEHIILTSKLNVDGRGPK